MNMKKPVWIIPFLVFTLFVWIPAPFLLAQNTADGDGILEAGENADEELAKAAQNPVADMISLPLQNNTNFNFGPEEKTQNILNIQPVWPFSLTEEWNVITRTIVPVISQPGLFPKATAKTVWEIQRLRRFSHPRSPASGSGGWDLSCFFRRPRTKSWEQINGAPDLPPWP